MARQTEGYADKHIDSQAGRQADSDQHIPPAAKNALLTVDCPDTVLTPAAVQCA